jgi:hypothetical protein
MLDMWLRYLDKWRMYLVIYLDIWMWCLDEWTRYESDKW